MNNTRTVASPRLDTIDAMLSAWVLAFLLVMHGSNWFLASYPLLLLVVLLVFRRIAVPEASRLVQLMCAVLLSLASASTVAVSPVRNLFLRVAGTVAFYLLAAFWTKELISRAFELTGAAVMEIRALRPVVLVPSLAAFSIAFGGIYLLTFWTDPPSSTVLFSLWPLPFALHWLYLRHLRPQVALDYLGKYPLWQRAFGSWKTILPVIAILSSLGFGLEFLGHQNYLTWAIITVILFFLGLTILQIQRWESQASATQASG